MSTITSASVSFILSARIASIFPSGPFAVEGFATDDAVTAETVDAGEARMGVDGRASFAYVPRLVKQSIKLQADSPSIALFQTLIAAQDTLREVVILDGVLTYKATNRSYALVKGALTRMTPHEPSKRTLEAVDYEITWETVQPAPVA